ncbi:MAG: hypothetical protein IIB05_10780 [Bacteroidetes bacterium]|nr:hypothetical protein [Bacteroidota bacterium]
MIITDKQINIQVEEGDSSDFVEIVKKIINGLRKDYDVSEIYLVKL